MKSIVKVARKNMLLAKIYTVYTYIKLIIRKESKTNKEILNVINMFVDEEKLNNKDYLRKIKYDMLFSKLVYRIRFDEYFLFEFENLSKEGRRSFIGAYERIEVWKSFGTEESKKKFDDKYEAYKIFEKYYKRDIIKISNDSDYEMFENFVKKHDEFMVKPIGKAFGNGIYHVDMKKEQSSQKEIFMQILDKGESIIEERIQQVSEMAMFHPSSVNTVRLATFISGDEVSNCLSFLRMGRGNSVVDNAGAGGIFATIDVATGIVITQGISENGEQYIIHPDTGMKIVGYQIPKWNELLELTQKLARIVPEQKYVGWDLALTKDGWIVVEGNANGQLVHQYADKSGCRAAMEKILGSKMEGR